MHIAQPALESVLPAEHSPRAATRPAGAGAALGLVLLAILLGFGVTSHATASAALLVTKQADTADGVCDSDCSLREAIIAANANSDASTISVPASATKYLITNGLGDDSAIAGDFDISTTVTIEGAGIDQTIIDGNASDTVFHVLPGGNLTLKGLTVRNGKAIGFSLGGGIFSEGTLNLDSVEVSENIGPDFGAGGIYATGSVSTDDSSIAMNTGGNEGFGGLFASRAVDLENTLITENTASGTNSTGGAHLEWDARLVDVAISNNHASGENSVGGLYTATGDEIDLRRTIIADNKTSGNFSVGGWWNAASITGGNLVIAGNEGGDHGAGGIYNECCNGGLEISRAEITGNSGDLDAGGGLWNESAAIITNVTISGNISGASGASGVYSSGLLILENVTIAGNLGASGGNAGLWNDDTATVRNTIIATAGGPNCLNTDSITSEGGNISQHTGCEFTQPTDHENTNPMLGALGDNGGFSRTRALLPGSPAINAGVDCPPPATDQRGVERPAGACDSGAFEVGELQPLVQEWGDIRCDGTVAAEDVTAVLNEDDTPQISVLCPAPSDHVRVVDYFGDHLWGDINCDATFDVLDALALLRDIAGIDWAPALPCPPIGQEVVLE